jgi:Lsr2
VEEAVARREVVELMDDLDGSRIPQGEGQTIHFTLDGRALEIDLNKKNADKLRNTLAPYIAFFGSGTKVEPVGWVLVGLSLAIIGATLLRHHRSTAPPACAALPLTTNSCNPAGLRVRIR